MEHNWNLRRAHKREQLAGLDDTIHVRQQCLGLLRLAVLDSDRDTLPGETPKVSIGELGIVAPNHLLNIRHLAVVLAVAWFSQDGRYGRTFRSRPFEVLE